MITTLTDLHADFTIHKITGEIDTKRLPSTLRILQQTTTKKVLWDLRDALNIANSPRLSAESISADLAEIPITPGGKAAFVFSSATDYGMGRMYEAYANMENITYELAMFQSMPEAEKWLKN